MNELDFLTPLVECFEKLPGVGKKTASRYAYAVIEQMSQEDCEQLATALIDIKTKIKRCECCGMITLDNLCNVCSNPLRDKSKIMIVKSTKDILALEKMGTYNGLYHSLNGLISPIEGIGPDDVNLDSLEKRLNEQVNELIVATPFTPQGETTLLFIEHMYANKVAKISRLGYGIPAGGDIEFIDEITLKRALENRR